MVNYTTNTQVHVSLLSQLAHQSLASARESRGIGSTVTKDQRKTISPADRKTKRRKTRGSQEAEERRGTLSVKKEREGDEGASDLSL